VDGDPARVQDWRDETNLCAVLSAMAFSASGAHAEIGHFNGGFLNIRDYFVPPAPGVYTGLYSYYYSTDRINDRHGDEIDSVNLNPGPGPGRPVTLNVDVDLFALRPVLIWEPDVDVLGGHYARSSRRCSPTRASTRCVGGSPARRRSRRQAASRSPTCSCSRSGSAGPRSTSTSRPRTASYAATGKYDTELRTVPVLGTVRVEGHRQHRVRLLDPSVAGRRGALSVRQQGHRGHGPWSPTSTTRTRKTSISSPATTSR
jgi:hypothetical protein